MVQKVPGTQTNQTLNTVSIYYNPIEKGDNAMKKPNFDVCPNCGEKLKKGYTKKSVVYLIIDKYTELINKYFNKKAVAYCNRCGDDLWTQANSEIRDKISELRKAFYEKVNTIPILTIHTPLNWDYDALEIVSGQSTTGTGIIAELGASITDFFGAQSGLYSDKLSKGETICFNQLRRKTVALGGNAVIAADVDYAEVGGAKGMLMVCAAGTAIRLKNPTVLGKSRSEGLEQINSILNDLEHFESFGVSEDTSIHD